MKASQKTEAGVLAVIDRMGKAYSDRDLKAVKSLFCRDKGLVVIGTGGDEIARGFEEMKAIYERDFSEGSDVSMEWKWRSVSAREKVAWFAGEAVVRATVAGKKANFPIRFTAVLEKRGDKWLIVQSHNSMAAAAQPAGKSYPTR